MEQETTTTQAAGKPRYSCKGPRFTPEEIDATCKRRLKEATHSKARLERLKKKNIVPLAEVDRVAQRVAEIEKMLADPFWPHSLRHDCGTDLTVLIEAVPADGLDYDVECPKCGTSTRVMRTPPEEAPPSQ